MSFTASSSFSLRRPVMKTYAPSSTKSFAVASAMPELAAVMTATFPSSFPITVLLSYLVGCGAGPAGASLSAAGIVDRVVSAVRRRRGQGRDHSIRTSLAGGVVHDHGGALRCERFGDGGSDTLGCTGDHSDFTCESAHFFIPLSVLC